MAELDSDVFRLFDARPPQDEYATPVDEPPPPSYNAFEVAFAQWQAADKAKLAIVPFGPVVASAEEHLKEAEEALEDAKAKSEKLFKSMHTKRRSFASFVTLGKLRKKSSRNVPNTTARYSPDPPPPAHRPDEDINDASIDQVTVGLRTSTIGSRPVEDGRNHPDREEEFKLAREAEMEQNLVVQSLQEKVASLTRQKEELSNTASAGDFAWSQLRQVAEEALSSRSELATSIGATMESLEGVENAYTVAKKVTSDLTHARLAVQNSHHYLKHALNICDGIRGLSGRALLGGVGGAFNDVHHMLGCRSALNLAKKAQICLNEVVRVLDPHEHMIPEDRIVHYQELKKNGVFQMSKIYNLLFGTSLIASGITAAVKVMLERQEAAYAHLTYLAVWIQERVPECTKEQDAASTSRDIVRREVAAFWEANINRVGDQA